MKQLAFAILASFAASAATITHTDSTGIQSGDYSELLHVGRAHAGIPDHVTLRLESYIRSYPEIGEVGFSTASVEFNGISLGQTWTQNLLNPYDGSIAGTWVAVQQDNFITENQPAGWNASFSGGGNLFFRVTVNVTDAFGVPQDSEAIVTVIYEYATVSPHVTR
jgi:hypothetical protein